MGGRTRTSTHQGLIPKGAQNDAPGAHKRRKPPRAAKPVPRDPLPPVCDLSENGSMGYLDAERLDGWEDNLKGRDRKDWEDFKGVMRRSDRNMRASIMAFVLQDELNRARNKYMRARNVDNEPFKAVLLAHNGRVAMDAIKRLDAGVWSVLDLSHQLQQAVMESERAYTVTNLALKVLAKLGNHWHDAQRNVAKSETLAAKAEKSLGVKP